MALTLSRWVVVALFLAEASLGFGQAPDPDLNNDGIVNSLDVSAVGSCWGQTPALPPALTILEPGDGAVVATSPISVSGTVDAGVSVVVNEVAAAIDGGTFAAHGVSLEEGANTITATATTASDRCIVADVDADGDVDADDISFVTGSFGQSGFPIGPPPPGSHTATASIQVTLEASQPGLSAGVVAGRVLDDTTGLAIEGASVELLSLDGQPVQGLETKSDRLGRYRLVSEAGRARLRIGAQDYTVAERLVAVVSGARSDPRDARLTPLDGAETPVSSVVGGEITSASGDDELQIAAASMAGDASVRLTAVGPQGLAGELPLGWSPVAAIQISPPEISFAPAARALLALPRGVPSEAALPVARWEDTTGVWRHVASASISQDGKHLQLDVSDGGQFVVLLADPAPDSPPPPAIGEELLGVLPPAVPGPVTAEITPSPRILFARADARSRVRVGATSPQTTPSGLLFETDLVEAFDFADGSHLYPEPSDQDFALYAFTEAGGAPDLGAAFTVSPSRSVTSETLSIGTIDLAVRFPAMVDEPRGRVVGTAGGTFEAASGERVVVPADAVVDPLPVLVENLAAGDFPAAVPAGLELAAALTLDLHGGLFDRPVELSVPLPSSLPVDRTVLVVHLAEVAGVSHLALVATAAVQSDRLATVLDPRGDGSLLLSGPRSGGRFAFLPATVPLGFVSGTVIGKDGLPFGGALVRVDALDVVALADGGGRFVLAAPLGSSRLSAIDPETGDEVAVTVTVSSADDDVHVDPELSATGPAVVAVTPADGAGSVPLTAAIQVSFSEPLDPTSLDTGSLVVSGDGAPIRGNASLAPTNDVLTFRPDALLASDTLYQVTVAATVRDVPGNPMGAPFQSSFTTVDVTPPPPPPAGSLAATIPDETGTSAVSGTQGTADPGGTVVIENLTTGALTTVIPNADGSFRATVAASTSDKLELTIRDAAGNETNVPLGPFRNPDGRVVVGSEGGRVEGPGGVFVDIPPGALPEGTPVKVDPLTAGDLSLPAPAAFPFVGGVRLDLGGVRPLEALDLGVSAPPDAGNGDQVVVATSLALASGAAWTVVDRAHLEEGRYVTASPPFTGVVDQGDYSFFRSEAGCLSYVTIHFELSETWVLLPSGMPFVFLTTDVTRATMPAVCDSEFAIEVRDADMDELIQQITQTAPSEPDAIGDVVDILTDDGEPPTILRSNVLSGQLVREVELRFSEPMNPDSVRAGFRVLDDGGFSVPGVVLLEDHDRVAVFRPTFPFQLAQRHTVVLFGVKDRAGNYLDATEIPFTPFRIPEPLSELGALPDFVDLIDKCGPTGCKKSTRDAVQIGTTLFLANGLGSRDEQYRDPANPQRLLAVDVSDPRAPRLIGSHSTTTNPLALAAAEGAFLVLPDSSTFDGDLLVVAGGGRVPGGELAGKIEVYDVRACTRLVEGVANCLDQTFLGARLLSTPGGVPPQPGVPPESGVPLQLALLHQSGAGGLGDALAAYVVVSAVGLEAVDIASAIGSALGPPDGLVRGDFLDVVMLKGNVVALVPDLASAEFRLELFSPQLVRRGEFPLPHSAARLFPLENFVVDVDEDQNLGQAENDDDDGVAAKDELFDLVVVGSGPLSDGAGCVSTVPCGELYVVDLSPTTDLAGPPTPASLGHSGPPVVIARIPLPGAAFSVQVDAKRLVAYVELRGKGMAMVDFATVADALRTGVPTEGLLDFNEDGTDDRVLAIVPKSDIFGGEVRVDLDRGLAFPNGSASGVDLTPTLGDWAELSADFMIPLETPRELEDERDDLLLIASSLVGILGNHAIDAFVLAQGSGACLFRDDFDADPFDACRAYDPLRSDHDLEVLVPLDRVNETEAILDDFIEGLFQDPGSPIPHDFVRRVNLFAVPIEFLERGELPIGPAADIEGAFAEDLGLGRQSLLLLWAVDGEYLTDPRLPELVEGPDLDAAIARLRAPQVPMPEGRGIPRLEGFEWTLLQEIAWFKSGALVRVEGFCDDPFFEPSGRDCEAQLRTVAKAAIRGVFARVAAHGLFNPTLILPPELNRSRFRFNQVNFRDNLCKTGVANPREPPEDPEHYLEKRCDSFEEYALSLAVRARLFADNNATIDDPFPGVRLSTLFRFYCVKVGPQACSAVELVTEPGGVTRLVERPINAPLIATDAEAHAFVLEALEFIESLHAPTLQAYEEAIEDDARLFGVHPFAVGHQQVCLEHGVFVNEDTPRADVRRCMRLEAERRLNGVQDLPDLVTVVESRSEQQELFRNLGLRRYTHLDLKVRVVNHGPSAVDARDETGVRMYEGDGLSEDAYQEHRDFAIAELRPLEHLVVDVEPDPDAPEGQVRPVFHTIFDTGQIPKGVYRSVAFVADPDNHVPEGDKEDNVALFRYYILDLPAVPPPPAGAPVPPPFDDQPDPLCIRTPQLEFTFGLQGPEPGPLGGEPELTAGIYEDVLLTYRLHNPNEFPLRNVSVKRAGAEKVFIAELPPGGDEIKAELFTPVDPGTELFLAVASAEDEEGDTLGREIASAVLHVTEDVQAFRIRFFDRSPLNDLDHPFSRWLVNREEGTGKSLEIVGAVTDGGGTIRIEIEDLIGAEKVSVSLEDAELDGVTDGVGILQFGTELEQEGVELTGLSPDANGHLTVFYEPPSVFVREAFRDHDSNWPVSEFKEERRVKLRVVQPDVGASIRQIRLRRPPVFLVHGFSSRRTDWNTFQPLVPPGGVHRDKYESVKGFDGRIDVFAVGWDLWTRPFAEIAPALSFDIGAALQRNYLQGYSIGKIDLVAHSMGGVLSRKIVNEDPRVAAAIRKFISIASPHEGSRAAEKLLEIRAQAPLKVDLLDLAQNAIVDPLDSLDAIGELEPPLQNLVKVQWCSFIMQLENVFEDSLVEGAVDDLAPFSPEMQVLRESPIKVPSHYVVAVMTDPIAALNPVFHLGVSNFYQGLWTGLGLGCNLTPYDGTIEATQAIQDAKDIIKALIPLGKASAIRKTTERREALLKQLKKTFKKYAKSKIFPPSGPVPVLGSSENDRLIAEESQRGRIPLSTGTPQFALTEVVGQTDHKIVKTSPDVIPAACLDGPVIKEHPEVVGDGTLASTCKVLHLLEADPENKKFFREVP